MSLSEVVALRKATLRAHPAPVTSVQFHPTEPWLVSGDEAGWCFWWSISQRRPIAIWRPHQKAIVAVKWIKGWDKDDPGGVERLKCSILLTHGRDNKIKVFRLNTDDPAGEGYTTTIPVNWKGDQVPDGVNNITSTNWKTPWMVHSQDVNTMNFCAVSVCDTAIAVPNTLNSEKIDIYNLRPEFTRTFFAIEGIPSKVGMFTSTSVSPDSSDFGAFAQVGGFDNLGAAGVGDDGNTSNKRSVAGTGIVMALILTRTHLIAGYESGDIILFDITKPGSPKQIYSDKTHQHPVLSLAYNPREDTFLSSSADSQIVKHSLKSAKPLQSLNTKHVGLTSLDLRSDGRIFATAGWDGMVRVYTYKNMKPLAAFKGSEGQFADKTGITSVTFSPVSEQESSDFTPESVSTDSVNDSRLIAVSSMAVARRRRASQIHWIAVAAKDGRIRLSDIY